MSSLHDHYQICGANTVTTVLLNKYISNILYCHTNIKYTPDKDSATTFKVKKVKILSHDKLRNKNNQKRHDFD